MERHHSIACSPCVCAACILASRELTKRPRPYVSTTRPNCSEDAKIHAAHTRGQAALSLIFLIGSIVLIIGTALAFVGFSLLNSTYGFQLATRAAVAAEGGGQDALLQLDRSNTFSNSGYSVNNGTDSATVVVTQNSPSTGLITITSSATVLFFSRKIKAIASLSSSTGQVTLLSWQPATFP